jgi:hypothetical protein
MTAVTKDDPWVLVPTGHLSPRSLNQDERVMTLIHEYLKVQKYISRKNVDTDNNYITHYRRLDFLDTLLQEMGVFESKHCSRETWRLKRLSKLTAAQRDSIDRNLMTETDREEYQTSQGRRYFGRYSAPVIFGISPPSVKGTIKLLRDTYRDVYPL